MTTDTYTEQRKHLEEAACEALCRAIAKLGATPRKYRAESMRAACAVVVEVIDRYVSRAQLEMLDEPPLAPTLEREAASALLLDLDVGPCGLDDAIAALLAARQRGREEGGALLRKAVGLLSDIDRLRGGIANVLDEYAGIAPKLGVESLDDGAHEAMRAAALSALRDALAPPKPLSSSRPPTYKR